MVVTVLGLDHPQGGTTVVPRPQESTLSQDEWLEGWLASWMAFWLAVWPQRLKHVIMAARLDASFTDSPLLQSFIFHMKSP